MTTLTVNIDNKKSETAVKAVLDALGLSYSLETTQPTPELNSTEKVVYKRLKKSFKDIQLHQEGKLQLKTIEELLAELS